MPAGGGGCDGILSATEARDVAAGVVAVPVHASIAATEGHDSAVGVGQTVAGILTRLEGLDTVVIAGLFGAPASAAIAEAKDVVALAGFTPRGTAAIAERRDTVALVGTYTARASASIVEQGDSAALAAVPHNAPTLAAVEGADGVSTSGKAGSAARIALLEASDLAALAGTTARHAGLSATEAGDRAALRSVAQGVPPFYAAVERGDVVVITAGLAGLRYNIYSNGGMGGWIDYAAPIATTGATSYAAGDLAPGSWSFGVRAEDQYGEELNLDCAVTIIISASDTDITNVPAPPTGLKAIPSAGASVKVEWYYPDTRGPKTPAGFHVYVTAGMVLSYGSPAATVLWGTRYQGMCQGTVSGLVDGRRYVTGVRAYNATGEETNTVTVSFVADGTGPPGVSGLTATTIV